MIAKVFLIGKYIILLELLCIVLILIYTRECCQLSHIINTSSSGRNIRVNQRTKDALLPVGNIAIKRSSKIKVLQEADLCKYTTYRAVLVIPLLVPPAF